MKFINQTFSKKIIFLFRQSFFIKRKYTYIFSKLFLIPKLKKQLSNNKNFFKINNSKKGRILIPLIETSHNQYHQLLIIGKALELRGFEVQILVCNGYLKACEIKSIKNVRDKNVCWNCKFNLKNIIPVYGIKTLQLQDFISNQQLDLWDKWLNKDKYDFENLKEILPFKISKRKFNNIIHDSIVRYFYGNVPSDKSVYKKLLVDSTLTFLISSFLAKEIDKKWKPNIVLSNMFVYSAWAPMFEYFNRKGKRYKTITTTQFNLDTINLDAYNLYPSDNRYHKFKSSLKNSELNKVQNKELDEFLNNRFSGMNKVAVEDGYFKNVDLESLKEKINFDITKRNVFLFSNIYWDIGMSEMNFLYGDVLTWVRKTIKLLANSDSVNLYIKTHPAEYFDKSKTLKGVAEIIREDFGDELPKNLFFIEPLMQIKPYDLFPLIDLGIIYSGTLGLEMLLNKIPVVSTGITPYLNQGFASEPLEENEYYLILKGEKDAVRPSIKEVRKFAYFYFIKSCIPWDINKQKYGAFFDGFKFKNLNDLSEGKNKLLDHICSCIIDEEQNIIENW